MFLEGIEKQHRAVIGSTLNNILLVTVRYTEKYNENTLLINRSDCAVI